MDMNIHEETLKIARNLIKKDPSLTDWVISKFPELKESEDEKIRKAIIKHFKIGTEYTFFSGFSKSEIIDWLEKQGDKDKLIQELGEYKVKYTQEVLEKHINSMSNKDDERLRKTTIAFLKDFAEQGYENAVECINWIKKQGEHANFRNNIQVGDKVTRNEDGVLVNLSQLNRVAKKE